MKVETDNRGLYYDFWLDVWRIRGGKNIQDQIVEGVNNCNFLLLMLSKKVVNQVGSSKNGKQNIKKKLNLGKLKQFLLSLMIIQIYNYLMCYKTNTILKSLKVKL